MEQRRTVCARRQRLISYTVTLFPIPRGGSARCGWPGHGRGRRRTIRWYRCADVPRLGRGRASPVRTQPGFRRALAGPEILQLAYAKHYQEHDVIRSFRMCVDPLARPGMPAAEPLSQAPATTSGPGRGRPNRFNGASSAAGRRRPLLPQRCRPIARLMETALMHFDGVRCNLLYRVRMPNDLYLLTGIGSGFPLAELLHFCCFRCRFAHRTLGKT
jgi:hypothetical protein